MNRNLFEMLSQASDVRDAGEAFASYMMAMFGVDPEQREGPRGAGGTTGGGLCGPEHLVRAIELFVASLNLLSGAWLPVCRF
jgi:hypothetical protein